MPVQVASMATKHLFVADTAWLYNAPKLWLFNLKNWSCKSLSFQPYHVPADLGPKDALLLSSP